MDERNNQYLEKVLEEDGDICKDMKCGGNSLIQMLGDKDNYWLSDGELR